MWEAETLVAGVADSLSPPQRVLIRIAPDTLRRWKEVDIDPLHEACAQLQDHLRDGVPSPDRSVLTLL